MDLIRLACTATPVNAEYPGVEVHANLIKSMLDGRFKSRPDYALAIELGQVLLAGLVLGGALAVLSPAWSMLLALGRWASPWVLICICTGCRICWSIARWRCC